jgi:hypothetical protein
MQILQEQKSAQGTKNSIFQIKIFSLIPPLGEALRRNRNGGCPKDRGME